ncbi:hypothetical protein LTR78_001870 [Recurvomyces mirabilis]|uniref:Uncharacterized protein n=1 Tax=Recurvomyces mirabilis TaxID=574656 RepID=A0AAE1C590_9PEZI|nr:hypothetical protein LTR78_001870 [Recurvomyces mirabilis]
MRSRVNPTQPATQSKLFLSKAKAFVVSIVRRKTVARAEALANARGHSQGLDHETKTSYTNTVERAISEQSEKLQRKALSGGVVKKVSSRRSLNRQDLKQATVTRAYPQVELDRSLRKPAVSKPVGESDDLDIDNQGPDSFASSFRARVDEFVAEIDPPASSASSFKDSGYASSDNSSEDSHMSDADDESFSPQRDGAAARGSRGSKFHGVFSGERQQYRDSDVDVDELAEDEAISMDFKWFKTRRAFRFRWVEATPNRTFVPRPTDHYETPPPAQDASPPPSVPHPTAQFFTPPPAQPFTAPPAFDFPTAATATPFQPPQVASPSPPQPAMLNIAAEFTVRCKWHY